MSILNILKKIKLPSFEDDFIQDPAENTINKAPAVYGARVICDDTILQDQESLMEWDKNTDPADPASGVMWINR